MKATSFYFGVRLIHFVEPHLHFGAPYNPIHKPTIHLLRCVSTSGYHASIFKCNLQMEKEISLFILFIVNIIGLERN